MSDVERAAAEEDPPEPGPPTGAPQVSGQPVPGEPLTGPPPLAGEPLAGPPGQEQVAAASPLSARTGADRTAVGRVFGPVLTVFGVLFAVAVAVLSAVVEILLAPLRVGGVLIGVAAVLAPLANAGLAWYGHRATGARWGIAVPWVAWTVVMLFAAGTRTDEGDLLLASTNWVATAMILTGSLGFAVYTYREILRGARRP